MRFYINNISRSIFAKRYISQFCKREKQIGDCLLLLNQCFSQLSLLNYLVLDCVILSKLL